MYLVIRWSSDGQRGVACALCQQLLSRRVDDDVQITSADYYLYGYAGIHSFFPFFHHNWCLYALFHISGVSEQAENDGKV